MPRIGQNVTVEGRDFEVLVGDDVGRNYAPDIHCFKCGKLLTASDSVQVPSGVFACNEHAELVWRELEN